MSLSNLAARQDKINVNIANGSDFPLESLQASSQRIRYPQNNHHSTRMSAVLDSVRGSTSTDATFDLDTEAERRGSEDGLTKLEIEKLLAKFDLRLLAPLFVMAMFHGFDKNVSHAKTMGFKLALKIDDNQWSTLLMTFYLGFMISTILIVIYVRKTGAAILKYLCAISVIAGLATMSNAVVITIPLSRPWIWITMTRLVQGLCEGAFSAMMVTYLLQFYTTTQLANRMILFFLVPGLSSATGAIYSFACLHLTNGSIMNWQLLFLGEGACTILVAILTYWILPGSVRRATFVTGEHTKLSLKLINRSADFSPESISFSQLVTLLRNPVARNWMLIDIALGIPATMVFLYLPQIILRIGFSTKATNFMTAFPYLAAVLALFFMIRQVNSYSKSNMIAVVFALQTLGFGVYRLTFLHSNQYLQYVAYASTFLMALGIGTTNVLAAKHYGPLIKVNEQRLVLNTLGVGLINLTGVITSWVFRSETFRSDEMTIAFVAMGLLTSVFGEWTIKEHEQRSHNILEVNKEKKRSGSVDSDLTD